MFIDFIKNNVELFIAALLALVTFILTLVKKKPVLNKMADIYLYILNLLPGLISSCEQPGNGDKKKALVMSEIKLLVAQEFKFYDWNHIENFVSEAIEAILETPSKKEV